MFLILRAYCAGLYWGYPYYSDEYPNHWVTKENAMRFDTREEAEAAAARISIPVKVIEA